MSRLVSPTWTSVKDALNLIISQLKRIATQLDNVERSGNNQNRDYEN